MSLISRIDSMKEVAIDLKKKQSSYEEAKLLQQRLSEINTTAIKLNEQIEQLQTFRKVDIDLSYVPDKIKSANNQLSKIRGKFNDEPKAKNLTKGNYWDKLQESINEISKEINEQLTNSWKDYVKESYTGESPINLRRILAPTDENNTNIKNYEKTYNELINCLKIKPNIDDFSKIKEIVVLLTNINSDFDFDVPKSVNLFLKSVAENGASLDLLTEEVREWLINNNTDSQYKIVGRH